VGTLTLALSPDSGGITCNPEVVKLESDGWGPAARLNHNILLDLPPAGQKIEVSSRCLGGGTLRIGRITIAADHHRAATRRQCRTGDRAKGFTPATLLQIADNSPATLSLGPLSRYFQHATS
jgi:hypothetical protein